MQARRPVYNRSKSADRLSLSIPPTTARHDSGTYLRPVTSRRSRAVSESSAHHHGIMPGSPLDYPDSMPLWHGSYDRVPSMTGAAPESVQLARGQAHYTTNPNTPTALSASYNHFRYPGDMTHAPPYNRQVRSVPTTPNAVPGQEHFRFPPPLTLLPSPQRSSDTEGVYESYGSDKFNQTHNSLPPTPYESLQGHHMPEQGHSQGQGFQPYTNNHHLYRQFSHPVAHQQQGQYNISSGHVLPHYGQMAPQFVPMTSALEAATPRHEEFDLSASMSQHSQQQQQHGYLEQAPQHRSETYSPDHYTQIHYPLDSTNPTDLVV